MKFNTKTYEELFEEIFGDLARKYNLKIKKTTEDSMSLISDGYILLIGIFVAGTNVQYIDLRNKKVYDLSDYIVMKTTDKDREGFYAQKIITDIVETSLRIRNNSLKNNFSDLLAGNNKWFYEYKNSGYFWEKSFRSELLI